jgi:hypothetical protein
VYSCFYRNKGEKEFDGAEERFYRIKAKQEFDEAEERLQE